VSVKAWPCRCCGETLGNVERGSLYPSPGAPVRVERNGIVWVACVPCSRRQSCKPGRDCHAGRQWVPAAREVTSSPISGMMVSISP
jgi:hypothetical protein